MPITLPNLRTDVPLAPYTTYRIGGPAEYFVEAASPDALAAAVAAARSAGMPYLVLGLGANVLVRDAGVRGLVILNRADALRIDGTVLTAGSGARVADAIDMTVEAGLSGFEHFAGIPSSIGGALWQNLHFLAPDRERTVFIAEILKSARVLEPDGRVHEEGPTFFGFGYDQSVLRERSDLIVTEASFILTPERPAVLRERAKANLAWRAARHPDVTEFPSCGSVFKKIEGIGAGRLIEQVGLKGYRLGGAQVSEKHANFIVNRDGATASDVLGLIDLIRERVRKETGHELEPEIRVVGE